MAKGKKKEQDYVIDVDSSEKSSTISTDDDDSYDHVAGDDPESSDDEPTVAPQKDLPIHASDTHTLLEQDRPLVPQKLTDRFGDIGFVKWTNAYCPVLVIDPIRAVEADQLSLGIYHAWMGQVEAMARRAAKPKRVNQEDSEEEQRREGGLPLLVYWYGTQYEVSLVSSLDLVSYEEGNKKNYGRVPEFIQRRYKRSLIIPTVYDLLMKSQSQFKIDLKKGQEERAVSIPWYKPSKTKKAPTYSQKDRVVLNEWHALVFANNDFLLNKADFLDKQQYLLDLLSEEVQSRFGQIGFVQPLNKGSKSASPYMHPVLCVSPFRCPPGPLRSEWFQRYQSVMELASSSSTAMTSEDMLGSMPVLVYWYGSYLSGHTTEANCTRTQNSTFSIIEWSRWVSYEQGQAFGYHELPEDVRDMFFDSAMRHHKYKKKASLIQDWLLCGHWEMEKALQVESPSDRWGGMEDFEEDYEQGLNELDYLIDCFQVTLNDSSNFATAGVNTKTDESSDEETSEYEYAEQRRPTAKKKITKAQNKTGKNTKKRRSKKTKESSPQPRPNKSRSKKESENQQRTLVEIIEIEDSSAASSPVSSPANPDSTSSEKRAGSVVVSEDSGNNSRDSKEQKLEETASTTDSDLEHDQEVHKSILGCAIQLVQSSFSLSKDKRLQRLKQATEKGLAKSMKSPKKMSTNNSTEGSPSSSRDIDDNNSSTGTPGSSSGSAASSPKKDTLPSSVSFITKTEKQGQSRSPKKKVGHTEKIIELKKRKARTEELVRGVIEDWTTRKKSRVSS